MVMRASQRTAYVTRAGAWACALCLAGAAAWIISSAPLRAQDQKDEYLKPGEPTSSTAGTAPHLKAEQIGATTGRMFKVSMSAGDEVGAGLVEFAAKYHITEARIEGLGGFDSAVLAAYDPSHKAFKKTVIDQKCEVASFIGTLSMGRDGKPAFHAHVVLGMLDGSARAGHLVEGHVNPVMDLFVTDLTPAEGSKGEK
jgi:predicted DNA-binding protein with PD1-like motif